MTKFHAFLLAGLVALLGGCVNSTAEQARIVMSYKHPVSGEIISQQPMRVD